MKRNLMLFLVFCIITGLPRLADSRGCGATFTRTSSFTSPGYIRSKRSDGYPHNSNCNWYIYAPGNYKIQLSFNDFLLENRYDKVMIYDSVGYSWSLKTTRTGAGSFNFKSTTNRLRITFTSDGSVSLRGFSAGFYFDVAQEPQITVPPNGITISSPLFPRAYPVYVWSSLLLTNSDQTKTLSLVTTAFNLGTSDRLEVRDGRNKYSPLLGTYSGRNKPPTLVTRSGYAWLLFTSDSYADTRDTGYQIRVLTGCKNIIDSPYGLIQSPGYGRIPYPNSYTCTWRVPNLGSRPLTFFIDNLYTEPGQDIVSARTVRSKFSDRSGRITNQIYFHTRDVNIDITFKTNDRAAYDGFNITFSPDCRPVRSLANGRIYTSFTYPRYKSNVTFECNDDYYLYNGEKNVTCQYGGQWSGRIPTCAIWHKPRIAPSSRFPYRLNKGMTAHITCAFNLPLDEMVLVSKDGKEYFYLISLGPRLVYLLYNLQKNQTGLYRCRERHDGRYKFSDWLPLEVQWLDSVNVSMVSRPTLLVNSSLIIHCNVLGGPSLTYTWFKNGQRIFGENETILNTSVSSTLDSGSYSCSVENNFSNLTSSAVNVTVWELESPSVTTNMEGYIKNNSNIEFYCHGTYPSSTVSFEWIKDGAVISNAPLLRFTGNSDADSDGTYVCRVSYKEYEKFSRAVDLTITRMLPPIMRVPNNRHDFMVHSNVTLKCIGRSDPEPNRYIWFKNEGIIANKTSSELQLNTGTTNKSGNYSCITQNEFNSKRSSTIMITIWELLKPTINVSPSNSSQEVGSKLTLTCMTHVTNIELNVTWFGPNNTIIQTSPVLEFRNLQENQNGPYHCQVTRDQVMKTSETFSVEVVWLEKPIISTSPSTTDLPINSSIIMTCQTDAYPAVFAYTWYRNDLMIPNAETSMIFIQYISKEDSGNYKCKAQNELKESVSNFVTVSIWEMLMPVVTTTNRGIVLIGENVLMVCASNQKNVVLTWLDDTGTIVSNSSKFLITHAQKDHAGKYRCKSTREDLKVFSRYIEIQIGFASQPYLSISPSNRIMEGYDVTFTCHIESYPEIHNVTWYQDEALYTTTSTNVLQLSNLNENSAGMYQCSIVNFEKSMLTSDSVYLKVEYLKNVRLTASPSANINEDDSLVLKCHVEGSGDISFRWYRNDQELSETTQVLIINTIQRTDAGNYECVASNWVKNITSDVLEIQVNYLDQPIITKTNRTQSHHPSLTLNCTTNGYPQPSYEWTHFGQLMSNSSTLEIDSINDTYIGMYVCKVSNVVGELIARTTTNQHYLNKPSLRLLPSEILMEGESLVILCDVKGSKPITYEWFKDSKLIGSSMTSPIFIIQNVSRYDEGNYRCHARNDQATKSSRNVDLAIHYVDDPAITISNTKPFLNTKVRLSCNAESRPSTNYEWYREGQLISSGASLVIDKIKKQDGGIYTCRASVGYRKKEINARIDVFYYNSLGIKTLPSKENITEGSTISITCIPDTNVPRFICDWSKDFQRLDTNGSCTLLLSNINRIHTGSYRCRGDAYTKEEHFWAKAIYSKWIHIKVDYIDEVHIETSNDIQNVTENEDVRLTCRVKTNQWAANIEWYYNDKLISNEVNLMLTNVNRNQSGNYVCKAVVGNIIKMATLNVNVFYMGPVEISILPSNRIFENSSFSITCFILTNHVLTYRWFKDNELLSNQSGSRLRYDSANRNQAGHYNCIAYNKFGYTIRSRTKTLDIEYLGSPYITLFKQSPIIRGDDVTLKCHSDSSQHAVTKWYHKGKIVGASPSLILMNVSSKQAGEYMCIVSLMLVRRSVFISLNVNYLNNVSMEIITNGDIFERDAFLIKCQGTSNEPITYELITPSKTIKTSKNGVFQFSAAKRTDGGLYLCKMMTEKIQKTKSLKVKVEWLDAPIISISKPLESISRDDDVNITCKTRASNLTSLNWYRNGKKISSFAQLSLVNISIQASGVYSCETSLEDRKREASINFRVNYIEKPVIESFPRIDVQNYIKNGTSLRLSCVCTTNADSCNYKWFKDGNGLNEQEATLTFERFDISNNGNYSCRINNNLKSKRSETLGIQVTYLNSPEIKSDIDLSNLNEGQNITLYCTTTGYPEPSYTWLRNGDVIHHGSRLVLNELHYFDTGRYTCVTSSQIGYSQSDYVDLIVAYLNKPTLSVYPNRRRVEGSTAVMSCYTSSNINVNYTWTKDGLDIAGGSHYVINDITDSHAGLYACRVTNGREEKMTVPEELEVLYHETPLIEVLPVKSLHLEGEIVEIACKTFGNPPPRIHWYKDGVNISNDEVLARNLTREDAGVYECKSFNEVKEEIVEKQITVYYLDYPSIRITKDSQAVIGQNVSLVCQPNSNLPGIEYTWYKNELRMNYPNNSILFLKEVSEKDNAKYQCHSTTNFGERASNTFELVAHSGCPRCHAKAECIEQGPIFKCKCFEGFHGDGISYCASGTVPETGKNVSEMKKENTIYKYSSFLLAGAFILFIVFLSCYVIINRKRKIRKERLHSPYVVSSTENPLYNSIIADECSPTAQRRENITSR